MANILLDPTKLANAAAVSPPPEMATGSIIVNAAVDSLFEITWAPSPAANTGASDILAGSGTITHDEPVALYLNIVVAGQVVQAIEVQPGGSGLLYFGAECGGAAAVSLVLADAADSVVPVQVGLLTLNLAPSAGVSLNCVCSDPGGRSYRTLKQLRDAIMRRLGWGNQLANPPPGSVDMINSFLYEAQYSLYMRFDSLRGERYFTWQLLAGVGLYGLNANLETCAKVLNPDKIHWVGVVRPGNLWTTLVAGIPELLNSYPNTSGYPVRYELRQCLQVWPVPTADAGQLVIKGIFDLLPFAADTDVCTVDDSMVFALALADAKAHYRQPDADRYIGRAEAILNALVAGTHTTRRYIPGNNRGQELVYVQPMPSVPFPS